jgi:hypothetical protein
MVRKLSELYFKESSLVVSASAVTTGKNRKSRLEHELAFLFGKNVVEQSQKVSIEQMCIDADLIAEAAWQLLQHKNQPEAQRRIVEGMDDDTAMALCKWINEAV